MTEAIFSQNVILPELLHPVPAIIFFKSSKITNISRIPLNSNPEDHIPLGCQLTNYQDLYISPGLVELNAILHDEHEDDLPRQTGLRESVLAEAEVIHGCTFGTMAAVTGGVTTIIESPSQKEYVTCDQIESKIQRMREYDLYCDVGLLAQGSPKHIEEIPRLAEMGIIGLKVYLISQGLDTPYFNNENISQLLSVSKQCNMPLFIHPERTNERYLFISSPYRESKTSDRAVAHNNVQTLFAGAYPEDFTHGSDLSGENTPITSPTKIQESLSNQASPEEFALEKRIKQHSQNLEWLVKAEMNTYNTSGITQFRTERVFQQNNFLHPETAAKQPIKQRRPPPISCMKSVVEKDNSDYNDYLANSPPHWESNGVQLILNMILNYPCKAHFCNLSAVSALYDIRRFLRKHPTYTITYETSSIYLYFSSCGIQKGDTRLKASPPIRDMDNKELLTQILMKGGIDAISSYHKPVQPSLKFLSQGDFTRALSGVNSLGFTLQASWKILYDKIKDTNRDARQEIVKLTRRLTSNPAQIAGIYNVKGSISVGKDADFVVWDPWDTFDCNMDNVVSKYPELCPFIGQKMMGRIVATYLRGEVVYRNGSLYEPTGRVIVRNQ